MDYRFNLVFDPEISKESNRKIFKRYSKSLIESIRTYFIATGVFVVIAALAWTGEIDIYSPVTVTIGVVFLLLGLATYRNYLQRKRIFFENVTKLEASLKEDPAYSYWINDTAFGLKTSIYHLEYAWLPFTSVFIEDGILYLQPVDGGSHTFAISEKEIGLDKLKEIKAAIDEQLNSIKKASPETGS